jgi:hypothetical protein
MKSIWIFICFIMIFSLNINAQEFQIKIDGEKDAYYNTLTGPDDGWLWIPSEAFNNNGPQPDDNLDLSANWFTAWDPTYLYVYCEVTDELVFQTSGSNYWQNDCFDAKVDPDFSAGANNEVFCFTMTCMDSGDVQPNLYGGIADLVQTVGGGWVQGGDSTAIKSVTSDDYARVITDNGYILECRIKWDWIVTETKGPIAASVGTDIGFAVSIHDNDNGASTRDNSIEWAAALLDNVWNNCSSMGYMELLPDHKIKYVAESLRDPSIINPTPEIYIPAATEVSSKSDVLKSFTLSQNYPNPFNPVTAISYTLPKSSEVKISVYDFLGNEVAILENSIKPAGIHTAQFNGSNLSSGIYFYRLQSEGKIISRKMVLLK